MIAFSMLISAVLGGLVFAAAYALDAALWSQLIPIGPSWFWAAIPGAGAAFFGFRETFNDYW